MNRPNPLDYENHREYHAALVVYCDALEEELEKKENVISKACENLGLQSPVCPRTGKYYEVCDCDRCEELCASCWRNRLMKEVQDE